VARLPLEQGVHAVHWRAAANPDPDVPEPWTGVPATPAAGSDDMIGIARASSVPRYSCTAAVTCSGDVNICSNLPGVLSYAGSPSSCGQTGHPAPV
jgi:hypothetical protein